MAEIFSNLSPGGASGTPSGGGANYALMSTWAAVQTDLVANGDTSVLECYGGFTTANPSSPTGALEDWLTLAWPDGTTSATNGITIRAAAGQKWDYVAETGFAINRPTVNETTLVISSTFVTIEDIGIYSYWLSGAGVDERALMLSDVSTQLTPRFNLFRVYCAGFGVNSTATFRTNRYVSVYAESCIFFSDASRSAGLAQTAAFIENRNSTAVTEFKQCLFAGGYGNAASVGMGLADGSRTFGGSYTNCAFMGSISTTATAASNPAPTWQTCAFSDDLSLGTNSIVDVSNVAAVDFIDYLNQDFNPVPAAKLAGTGDNATLPANDFIDYPFADPPSVAAYEIQGPQFIGPDIESQLGVDGEPFVFNKDPNDTDVFERFSPDTGLTFTLQSGTLPAGMSINATTGDPEGTPTEAGSFPGIIIRGDDT
jgi:hypothetical protein